jgi:HEAT repeat protein
MTCKGRICADIGRATAIAMLSVWSFTFSGVIPIGPIISGAAQQSLERFELDWSKRVDELLKKHRLSNPLTEDDAAVILLALLDDANPNIRSRAADALAIVCRPGIRDDQQLAPLEVQRDRKDRHDPPKKVVATLLRRLADPEHIVRIHTGNALGRLEVTDALPTLRKLADDPDGGDRLWVADILIMLKDETGRARRIVREALKHPKSAVRANAVWTLGRLRPSGDPGLLRELAAVYENDQDRDVRFAVLQQYLGPPGVPFYVKVLDREPDTGLRHRAVIRLSEIGPPAREAVPALERLAKSPDVSLREIAAQALSRINSKE